MPVFSRRLEYAPTPADNPLKGLVPYQGDRRDKFPHSMEFNYIPLSSLVKNYDDYDWKRLDNLLGDVASRGHQTVFRIYLEYPNDPNGKGAIPPFLIADGLKVTKWRNTNTQPLPPDDVITPDYEDPKLRRVLRRFIAALGSRYDGDKRVAFITAGLLGSWGEWHTYPRSELFASKTVQAEVIEAYAQAFRTTPVLFRYPSNGSDGKAPNHNKPVGYHDDSFAYATLHTGAKDTEWHFESLLKTAGPEAVNKWKKHPIGGEIRPEVWGDIFDPTPKNKDAQNFRRCVETTHASWVMDSGMFEERQSPERIARAKAEVSRMGYEFHVSEATAQTIKGYCQVRAKVENRGVAPFYYAWPTEFAFVSERGLVRTIKGDNSVNGLLPAQSRVWTATLPTSGIGRGTYWVALRVPNPLTNGKPLRFANTLQDEHAPGWLSLTKVTL